MGSILFNTLFMEKNRNTGESTLPVSHSSLVVLSPTTATTNFSNKNKQANYVQYHNIFIITHRIIHKQYPPPLLLFSLMQEIVKGSVGRLQIEE